MCRYLSCIARNEYQQSILICEHDTLHILHHHTTIVMSRAAFYHLADLIKSRCLSNCEIKGVAIRFKRTQNNQIELWVGSGGFLLSTPAWMALASLIEKSAAYIRSIPLDDILQRNPDYQRRFSQN